MNSINILHTPGKLKMRNANAYVPKNTLIINLSMLNIENTNKKKLTLYKIVL